MENGFPNFGSLMNEAKKIQEKLGQVKVELENKIIETSSGGGMIKVKINGKNEIVDLKIEKELIDMQDYEMLRDLIIVAVNEGIRQSKNLIASEIRKHTMGINIPGLANFL